jgi:hypothetical protein
VVGLDGSLRGAVRNGESWNREAEGFSMGWGLLRGLPRVVPGNSPDDSSLKHQPSVVNYLLASVTWDDRREAAIREGEA